tara:strand:+ start:552 stop:758 length:207 start_codon:yes stop_codon:yes gene_type:complete
MTSLNDKFILGRLTYLFYCYWASYKQEQINLKILKNFHLDEPIDSDLDFYKEQLVTITAQLTNVMGPQ